LADVLVIELCQVLSEDFDDLVEGGLPHDLFDGLLVRERQVEQQQLFHPQQNFRPDIINNDPRYVSVLT